MCFMKTPIYIVSEGMNGTAKSKEKGTGIQMKRRDWVVAFYCKVLAFPLPVLYFHND